MTVRVAENKDKLRLLVFRARDDGSSIGLVPTMGNLHRGHLSLISLCRSECDITVLSIFVNPTQFGPGEDFDKYPRTLESDLSAAEKAGVDIVFNPSAAEMYAPGFSTGVHENAISQNFEGKIRPGHFDGVTTVVSKLFNIVAPDAAFFGRKDLQQLAIVRRMVEDLDFPIRIVDAPIVREENGLAMSSRNSRLSAEERQKAGNLYKCLRQAADRLRRDKSLDIGTVVSDTSLEVERLTGGKLDYLDAVDKTVMLSRDRSNARYIAAALRLGDVRLIDNVELGLD